MCVVLPHIYMGYLDFGLEGLVPQNVLFYTAVLHLIYMVIQRFLKH